MYSLLNKLYGQLRGYGRWSIYRQVMAATLRAPSDLAAERDTLFQQCVRDAVGRFPVYAEKVRRHRGAPPVWTRQDQRALFESLDGPPVRRAHLHSTGGSTGVPLKFYVTRESYEWRSAVSDRGYSWAGAQEGRRSFYVWGTPIYPPSRRKQVKLRLHHWLQRRTYFDSFDFDDDRKQECCRQINNARPLALVGYAGNLVSLAFYVRQNPTALTWRAGCCVTAAEGLHAGQRELLEETLCDDAFMSYGSREFMLIGMECAAHRGYHVSSDNLLVEVVNDNGAPSPPGETGRIVVTDLRNAANPFIRYEIGDLGAMADPREACPCGLPFPRLLRVDGRTQETIARPNGEKLTALFIPHLMKEFTWIEGYQILQEVAERITVQLVTASPIDGEGVQPIREKLLERVGADMQIEFTRVAQLRKNASGKTPIVISEIRN